MERVPASSPSVIYRHHLPVRVMHWVNVVCLVILLMSGLQIFNAHPALYWGDDSRDSTRVMQIASKQVGNERHGVTRIGKMEFDTHGVLGTSRGGTGGYTERAFPSWATIPSSQWLSMARVWHFFFAWLFVVNGIAYLVWTIFSGHLRRDLVPTTREVRGIGRSICEQMAAHGITGDAAFRTT